MHRRLLTIFSALILLALCSCSKINSFRVKSCTIESVTPSGLRGVNAGLLLEIDNPARHFTVSDVKGTIYYKGEEYGTYSADKIDIKGKSCEVYPLKCSATLSPSVSLLSLMSLIGGIDMEEVTTDINFNFSLWEGHSKNYTLTGLKVSELLNKY